ncbi:cyclase family protein [Micrococcoides hystricis]|uniref:Cyclase family protein n=1 Tax=Micrococcoides hystricis TaxID=1572761 RepID=A0ABV6P6P2_9MICC
MDSVRDLTQPWQAGMPAVAGDPSFQLNRLKSADRDGYALHRFVAGSHTGTHFDAPAHLFPSAQTVDQVPLDQFCGRARVLQAHTTEPQCITADQLGQQLLDFLSQPEAEPIVLIATGWDRWFSSDPERYGNHPYLSTALAALLRDQGVKLVGIDTFSPDAQGSVELPVHQVLLAAGILIVENLCGLTELPPTVNFSAYPLPLVGADAAPVRAIASLDEGPQT